MPQPNLFDGATYEPERDQARLSRQARLVLDVMLDGNWLTLAEIARVTGCPEASVSARLRDLRKWRYGRRTIERRYVKDGLHEYRLVL